MSTRCSLTYQERPFHPLPTIDFFLFCFHQLTKPSSSNSPVFTYIQNAGGMGSLVTFRHADVPTCRQTHVFSYIYKLFGSQEKLKSFPFNKIQTLFAKCRGVAPSSTGTFACVLRESYSQMQARSRLDSSPRQLSNVLTYRDGRVGGRAWRTVSRLHRAEREARNPPRCPRVPPKFPSPSSSGVAPECREWPWPIACAP